MRFFIWIWGERIDLTAVSSLDTAKVIADSLEITGKADSGWIMHHVLDGKEIELPFLGYIHIPQFPTLFGIVFGLGMLAISIQFLAKAVSLRSEEESPE